MDNKNRVEIGNYISPDDIVDLEESIVSPDDIITFFEKKPNSKVEDLPEEIAYFLRASRNVEIVTSADFLAKIYLLHLKKTNKTLPKSPSDYNMEFIDRATNFFDYISERCLYVFLKSQGILEHEDENIPLLESNIANKLKARITKKGTELYKNFQNKLNEIVLESEDKK